MKNCWQRTLFGKSYPFVRMSDKPLSVVTNIQPPLEPKPSDETKLNVPVPITKPTEQTQPSEIVRRYPERNTGMNPFSSAKMFHPHNGRNGFQLVEPSEELLAVVEDSEDPWDGHLGLDIDWSDWAEGTM